MERVVAVLAITLLLTCGVARAAPIGGGLASWYGARHEGRRMANGCPFHARALTGASRSLPIGAWVRVTNRKNRRSIVVPITDRGPYIRGRIIDLSLAAAEQLDMTEAGIVPVSVETLPARNRPHAIGTAPCHPS